MAHHPNPHQFESGVTHEAVALDPEHDIDARSATMWVVGGAVVLFLSLWLMVPIFMRVVGVERQQKIELAGSPELDAVRDAEHDFLNGQNPTRKNIRDVVDALRKK
jgi:hypothetical protein